MARVAAALGREFTFDLLHASVPQYSADDLQGALQRLVQAELVSPSASSAQTFTFRHALIQDAAYGMLPRDERKALHERIAIALENRFPEIIAAQPEIAADHFTKAGLIESAIRYWTEAGNRAVRGSALIDAAKHFSEAIRLVQALPSSPARDQTELGLHLALGPVTHGDQGLRGTRDTASLHACAGTCRAFQSASGAIGDPGRSVQCPLRSRGTG